MDFSDFWTSPSLGPFAGVIEGPLRTIIAILWCLLLIGALVKLMFGVGALATAKRFNRHEDMEKEKSGLIFPSLSVVVLLAFPALVAAITAI